jgi:tetratricopeptide (TPR) repeat protein
MFAGYKYYGGYDGGYPAGKSGFDRALEYEAAGRIATACEAYKAYAEECAALRRYEEAITCLLKVESYGYLDIEGRLRLAEFYRLSGDPAKSAETYQAAAEDLTVQGKPDDAIDVLRNAVSKLPDQTMLVYRLARFYEDLGLSAHAVSILMDTISERPNDTDAMIALAEVYRNRNSITEAVDVLVRAAEVFGERSDRAGEAVVYELISEMVPYNVTALKKLVDIYKEIGDNEKVLVYMHAMARLFIERNRKERALNIYAAILNLDPDDETAQKYVGDSIRFVSVLPHGEKPTERVEREKTPSEAKRGEITDGEPGPTAEVGKAKIKTDFPPDKPVRTARDLLGFDPDTEYGENKTDPQVSYDLGLAYLEMGLIESGIKYLQLASRNPSFRMRACNLLGLSFLDMGMPDIAVKEFERGLETPGVTEDEKIGLFYNLALAYEASGDTKAAMDELRKVYSLNINYLDVKERLRTIMQKQLEGTG